MTDALPGSPKTSAIRAHRGGSAIPWNASSYAGVKIRPRAANSSVWAWVQQDSVSTSVPSQSNATACGIQPSNGQGVVIWCTVSFLIGGETRCRKEVTGRWQRAGRDGRIQASGVLPARAGSVVNTIKQFQTLDDVRSE